MLTIPREAGATARARPLASSLAVVAAASAVLALTLVAARLDSLERSARSTLEESVNLILTVSTIDGTPLFTENDVDASSAHPSVQWAAGHAKQADLLALDQRLRHLQLFVAGSSRPIDRAPESPFVFIVAGARTPFETEGEMQELQDETSDVAVFPIETIKTSEINDPILAGAAVSECIVECGLHEQIRVKVDSPDSVASVTAYLERQFASRSDRVGLRTSEDFAQLSSGLSRSISDDAQGVAFLTFAVVAAVFALVGVVGTVQRRREIGRRRVLGCTRSGIVAIMLWENLLTGAMGVGLGIGAGSLARSFYFSESEVGVVFAVAAQVLTIGAVAGIPVALVALAVDPVKAVRMP